MGGQDGRQAKAVCRHDCARLYHRTQRRSFPLLSQSERVVIDAFVPSDLIERQRRNEHGGTRTCGEPADPRARVPRERHEHAFHLCAVGLGHSDRMVALASSRDDSVPPAYVRRRPCPLHRRDREDHGPERLHQSRGLRLVRGGTQPPVGHGRTHGKFSDRHVRAGVPVERDPALFPRRGHRQGHRRTLASPVGHRDSPRAGRGHRGDLHATVHLQRVDAGVRRVDEPVDDDHDRPGVLRVARPWFGLRSHGHYPLRQWRAHILPGPLPPPGIPTDHQHPYRRNNDAAHSRSVRLRPTRRGGDRRLRHRRRQPAKWAPSRQLGNPPIHILHSRVPTSARSQP